MPKKTKISLTIDDVPVQVDAGTTIMEAAEQIGVRIPRLCYHPDLSLAGSCRVCIVEVKEMPFYMASCSVTVWEGMEVPTTAPPSASVIRDPDKCILCGRCVRVCAEIQGVYNLSQHGRGFHTVVGPASLANMDDSVCIQCGQCINVCPTAAFLHNRGAGPVWDALADPQMHVVVQTAPSIRAAIGEGFGLGPG